MGKIILLLVFFCVFVACEPSKVAATPTIEAKASPTPLPAAKKAIPADPVEVATQYLGETEDKGANRSTNVDKWNKFAGVPAGSFWCASFVSYCYFKAGYKAPISAWSPSFFSDKSHLVNFEDIKRNDAVGFYFKSKGRVAHIGLIEKRQGEYVVTIEGNTSPDEKIDRNGGGVYRKFRASYLLKDPRNKFSQWN